MPFIGAHKRHEPVALRGLDGFRVELRHPQRRGLATGLTRAADLDQPLRIGCNTVKLRQQHQAVQRQAGRTPSWHCFFRPSLDYGQARIPLRHSLPASYAST
ncbi:hypothetical protein [Lysobacter tyrosinilyticus]